MNEAMLAEVVGCKQVLIEIRDLLAPTKPLPALPLAPSTPSTRIRKLTSAQVAKQVGISTEALRKWLTRRPELRVMTEEQGPGKTLLWDPKVLYWFETYRGPNGRYREP